jgi:hypothetical protein
VTTFREAYEAMHHDPKKRARLAEIANVFDTMDLELFTIAGEPVFVMARDGFLMANPIFLGAQEGHC